MKQQKIIPKSLYNDIKIILEGARQRSYRAVNFLMVEAYWNIGKLIVEEEQKGKSRADYGTFLIKELSERLTKDFGSGFDASNIRHMRQFYLYFPIQDAVRLESSSSSLGNQDASSLNSNNTSIKLSFLRTELSWTHYRLLLRVNKEEARYFYMNETANSNWSTRELERQINSLLFERLALSKNKKAVMKMAKKGQIIVSPGDLVKDPYVLEFLGLEKLEKYYEEDLEKALINHLQRFLLELGKGFSFVARQK